MNIYDDIRKLEEKLAKECFDKLKCGQKAHYSYWYISNRFRILVDAENILLNLMAKEGKLPKLIYGNDAKRGGQSGNFVEISDKNYYLKKIRKEKLDKLL